MAVTRDPALIWNPVEPEAYQQPGIIPYQWIVHTAVDGRGPTNLGDYFEQRSVTVESHTWLRWDRHEQFIPFDRSADANFKVNRFLARGIWRGAISTETEDDGSPEQNPWNEYQVNELVRFGVWLNQTFQIPPVIPAGPYDPGMGYHSLHPMVWTNVPGKTCPGRTRIIQFRNVVLPRIREALEGDLDLTMSQFTTLNDKLDHIKREVDTTAGELFHFKEMTEPVPPTGQRKSQFWALMLAAPKLLAAAGKLDEALTKLDQVHLRIDNVGSRLTAIEQKLE